MTENYYAIRKDAKCKICGRNHGFMTFKHCVIIANDASIKILENYLQGKYQIVAVTKSDLIQTGLRTIWFTDMVKYT